MHFDRELLEVVASAQHIVVLTGAGISAESGVPTFRDAQSGLWSRFRPEELATAAAYSRHPKLVWDWYEWRRGLVAKAEPNEGHFALVAMEARVPRFHLITQNVDGLHVRAGSKNVIELHGNIHRNKCFSSRTGTQGACQVGEDPPRCLSCNGLLRPDVVWFGEALPGAAFERAEEAARQCDLFFSIGTSAAVFPAAGLPISALRQGATLLEINPEETTLSSLAAASFRAPAGQVLPALVAAAWP